MGSYHLSYSVLRGIPPRFPRAKRKTIRKSNSNRTSSRAAQDGPLGNVLLPGPPDQQSVADGVISPTDRSGMSVLRSISADMQLRTGVRTQKGTWSGHCGHRGLAWGQDKIKIPWNMANVPIESGVKGKRPDPPAHHNVYGRVCGEFDNESSHVTRCKTSSSILPFLLLYSDEGRTSPIVLD